MSQYTFVADGVGTPGMAPGADNSSMLAIGYDLRLRHSQAEAEVTFDAALSPASSPCGR